MRATEPGGNQTWHRDGIRCAADPLSRSDIVSLDPRFDRIVLGHAAIERIATGFRFTEGPVWFGDGRNLLFSDIPNDRIMRWDEETGAVSAFRPPSHYANGNTRDRQGRLITCEMGSQRLTRTEYDGTITVLADSFEGKRLTGPNDVVVKSDGSIWFSDNGAGIRGNYLGHTAPQELPYRVYRIDGRDRRADDRDRRHGAAERAGLLAGRDSGSMSWTRRTATEDHAGLRHGGQRDEGGERPHVLRRCRAGPTAYASTPRAMYGAASRAARARTAWRSSLPTAR